MKFSPITKRPVRGAIFGYGSIGPVHMNSVRGSDDGGVTSVPDVEIVAVAEPLSERAARVPEGITIYSDYQTLLKEADVDVVHICLAHNLHAPAVIAAAEAGKYIICEKPMALDAAEALTMRDAVEKNGVGFSLISQNRLNPEKVWLKKHVVDGDFGAISRMDWKVDWYRSIEYYADSSGWRGKDAEARGGVLTNQAYHTLDLVMWLADSPVVEITAKQSVDPVIHPGNDVPDFVEGNLVFGNGIKTSFLATVCGDKRDIINVQVTGQSNGDSKCVEVDGVAVLSQNVEAEMPVFESVAEVGGKSCYGNSHQENIARGYEAFMAGTPVPVDAETGIRVLTVIDAILNSNGTPVELG
jgi:UDP-N-acetyl-2-amino-2-deoxyglucuronate dehydrogenase